MKADITAHSRSRQEELGQFLTVVPVADFMASMFGPLPRLVRLLDAGAGAGALTHAFVSRLCERNEGVRAIEATLYELDPLILDDLSATMRECARHCAEAGKIPDVIVHYAAKNWLLLIEAVTSAGPVDGKRRKELKDLFAGCKAGLVFVTAFENRRTMQSFVSHIAWESEVWIAEDPDHMIHFNGERFLGPYPDVMPNCED
jgi:hypothetical protein